MRLKSVAALIGILLMTVTGLLGGEPNPPKMDLALLKGRFTVCRLAPKAKVPAWALEGGAFVSVTRTRDELSVLCPEGQVPEGVKQETGWRAFKVAGPLDFSLTGILLSLADPLARAGVSIYAVSTYDTDYVFVKEQKLDQARQALLGAGHRIKEE